MYYDNKYREKRFLIAAGLVAIVGALFFVVLVYGADTFSPKDMTPEDQAKVQELGRELTLLDRELDLAQTKLELAQSKLQRLNEVQIPRLVDDLRSKYNKPKEQWDFDLMSFTFVKKEK